MRAGEALLLKYLFRKDLFPKDYGENGGIVNINPYFKMCFRRKIQYLKQCPRPSQIGLSEELIKHLGLFSPSLLLHR